MERLSMIGLGVSIIAFIMIILSVIVSGTLLLALLAATILLALGAAVIYGAVTVLVFRKHRSLIASLSLLTFFCYG